MTLSPFSLQHNWTIDWNIIPSGINIDNRVNIHTKNERRALEAIASVGVISKSQLRTVFSLNDKEILGMEKTFKILKHELIRNKKDKTYIYTLNTKGAIGLGLDNYKVNYWLELYTNDVIKRLLFFQLYEHLPDLNIMPSPEPFVASLETESNMIYIYIAKGGTDDLARFLKWEKTKSQRIIIVVENINHLKPLELYFKDLKLRLAVENDLVSKNKNKKDIFYTYQEGKFIR